MLFSERNKYTEIQTSIQRESMDDALRTKLWNLLSVRFWDGFENVGHFRMESVRTVHIRETINLFRRLWINYFNWPINEFPLVGRVLHAEVKDHFFDSDKWYIPYDFIEAVLTYADLSLSGVEKFANRCNVELERHMSAYRIVGKQVIECTGEEEIAAIKRALAEEEDPIKEHLVKAMKLLSNRPKPDHSNSIKESLSAVESKIKQILNKPKITLARGLTEIEQKYGLHPSLKKGFGKLYGYASDESGIRHGGAQSKMIHQEEAVFFLVSCSAFVSYLSAKTTRNDG